MLGAIIGDIAGSKYEFNNTFDYDFEMFGEARFGIPQDMKEMAISYLPDDMREISVQGKRIKLRCPPKVLTGTLHPSLPSIFSG